MEQRVRNYADATLHTCYFFQTRIVSKGLSLANPATPTHRSDRYRFPRDAKLARARRVVTDLIVKSE